MNDCVAQYRKTLKKKLRCPGSTRKRLVQKFNSSAAAFSEDHPKPSMDEVYTAFGPPEEMASILMAEVTPKEAARYRRRQILSRIAAGILAAIFVAITIYVYFQKDTKWVVINEIIVTAEGHHPATSTDPTAETN